MDRVDYESIVIQDLLNSYTRNELVINPWYQRRAVWNRSQKSYLINTIHESKPVPSIYIRHTIDLEREMSTKEVVDGQQRIRCLIEYKDDEFSAPHPEHQSAAKFSQLTKTQKSKFLLTGLSVGYLIDADDSDVIEIFARINSVAKTLNPQEKRNAQFSGEFKRFSLKQAVDRLSFWRSYGIFSDNNIARMAEVQFMSDLIMNLVGGLQDFSADKLSKYYKDNDNCFEMAESVKKRLDRVFSLLLELPHDALKGTIFCNPQILFSLILVLDSLQKPSKKKIERCISEIDARVCAVRFSENPGAMPADQYEAFSSGNLHRIKFRSRRAELISEYLK